MKASLPLLLLPFALSHCVPVETGGSEPVHAMSRPGMAPGFTQPLTAVTSQGAVTIREGAKTLSACQTAMPNVEETRWVNEQEQIAVKSRGNHGPATVQLFDCRTGRENGRVMAYEIRDGKPAWAASMAE